MQLFETPPLAGPYVELTFDDMDDAYDATLQTVAGHIAGAMIDGELHDDFYIDDDDAEQIYEVFEHLTHEVLMEHEQYMELRFDELGFEIEAVACSGCTPKGMN